MDVEKAKEVARQRDRKKKCVLKGPL